MAGDNTDDDFEDDVASEDASEDETGENIVIDPGDSFGDTVVEANVDALVAKLDSADADEVARKRAAKKRLDELREQENEGIEDTFNFNLDDEL